MQGHLNVKITNKMYQSPLPAINSFSHNINFLVYFSKSYKSGVMNWPPLAIWEH